MIAFLRSIHVSVDSRLTRYIQALEVAGKRSLTVHWSRGGSNNDMVLNTELVTFSLSARLGSGWKNGIALLLWMCWSFFALVKNHRHIQIVHAVDLDTALPALFFSKIFRKKFIFDIYDSYGDARSMSGVSRKIVDTVEGWIALHADCVILPDTCRIPQVPAGVKQIQIIENVPFRAGSAADAVSSSTGPIKLAYVGILERSHRGLEDLLAAVAANAGRVELHIAGFGQLADICAEFAQKAENIHYYGALAPDAALHLMAGCDVVIGMYYRTKAHHFRATPNKYFEHLMLGKPLVTTAGIPPGLKVVAHRTGWAIEEGEESVRALIGSMSLEQCTLYGGNAMSEWEKKYADYFTTTLVGTYANEMCANTTSQCDYVV